MKLWKGTYDVIHSIFNLRSNNSIHSEGESQMNDLIEMWQAAAESVGDISEMIIDKFVSGISWAINKLFLHDKKYKHSISFTKQMQINFKRRIGMIIPYKEKH